MSRPPAHRICQACRKLTPKKELLRIVRSKEGRFLFDPEHKVNGRGYHFHKECGSKALVPGKISHFLHVENNKEFQAFIEKIKDQIDNTAPSK